MCAYFVFLKFPRAIQVFAFLIFMSNLQAILICMNRES